MALPALTTLVNFNDTGNGAFPIDGLIVDAAGNLFGTTQSGGTNSDGTVFEIPITATGYGTPTTLVNFNGTDNGANPFGGLLADAAGDLFGTTATGGTNDKGTVFEIPRTALGYGTPITLVTFNGTGNGANPFGGLIADAAGDLFGTTRFGGTNDDGTVFGIPKTATGYGALTTLVTFNGTGNGAFPLSGLLADAAGDLFGTTRSGGTNDDGTVFEIPITATGYGALTTLVTFTGTGNGANPYSSLIADAAGDLFGTTRFGGTNDDGTVFGIPKTATGYGALTTLVTFTGTGNGALPIGGLLADAAGDLFGTTRLGGTNDDGTVFEIPRTATGYSQPNTLFSFDSTSGANPAAGLVADAAGNLFGTTQSGGTNNDGTAFELTNTGFVTASLPPSNPTSPPVTYFTPPVTPPPSGVVGLLNAAEQLEMVYVGYFNRAADGAGFNFWTGQNTAALAAGQSTSQVLANIADAFTPQPETFALYPFLSTPNLDLGSPASLAGLNGVVTDIYNNLFGRPPDAAGLSYWVHQLSTGAIPLGEAVLAIANGAQGSDVTEILNKITVALDFTTRTGAAGSLVNAPATLIPAARSVLHGVDSTSLNDASVTAGENATTAYTNGATTSSASAAVASLSSASDTITVTTSNTVIDPGAGSHTIQFIAGVSADTVVLHSGGTDQIAGFDLAGGDVLDVRSLLAEAQLTPQDVLPNLGAYFTIANQGADAVLRFDSTGHGGGNAVAILDNLGGAVTSFGSLTSHNAVQI